jgi:glycosyltransferase involved in cell wall biosynthesis
VFAFQQDIPARQRAFYVRLERLAARMADRIVLLTEFQRRVALRERVAGAAKLVVIGNGVDLERFPPSLGMAACRRALGLPTDALVVGAVGRMTRQKGFNDLLLAAAQVLQRFPNCLFVLVGSGELGEELRQQARELGIESRVRFLGEQRDMVSVYAAMDVFVLPSLWEGMPYALLEAMAMAKPVVATHVCGMEEFVTHGETGLLVKAKDTTALVSAIESLLADGALRSRMGAAARRRVEANHSLHRTIAGLHSLYAKLF